MGHDPHLDPHLDLAAVLACDVTSLGTADAVGMHQRVRRLRGLLDGFEADLTNQIDVLYRQGRSVPAADVTSRQQHVSAAEARRRERRAKALARTRAFGEALAVGAVGAEHADVLANATTKLDEALTAEFFGHEQQLVAEASVTSPEQFARHCRNLVTRLERDQGLARNEQQRRQTRLTRKILPDGMHQLTGVFHPELGARIWTALDHEVASLVAAGDDRTVDRTQLAAEALGNLITGGHQAARPIEADVLVITDHHTLAGDIDDRSISETDTGAMLPSETIRRLCCQGRIIPVVMIDGVPVNLGRQQRLANRAQRRALRAMYRSCGFTGCDVGFNRCEIHHILPWELGGPTDLHNLLPLCSRHHHVVHELGWRLELAADRHLTIRQPDGTVYASEHVQIRPPTHQHTLIHQQCERARQRLAELQRC